MRRLVVRSLARVIASVATSDGAGVKLRRSLGSSERLRHDPFLLLDEFHSEDPEDYLAGFPPHPHRGFETVTYLLDGRMRHRDSGGNTGDLGPGDVQWMRAARGIVHSEMPRQSAGRMRGFQLWINLPAREKMEPAAYADIPAARIPLVQANEKARAKIIAGRLGGVCGPISGLSTDPHYFDVVLEPGGVFEAALPAGHNAFVYAYEGDSTVGPERRALPNRAAGLLSEGDAVRLEAGGEGARLLLLAGKPIGEPIVQYGPFVMNTREEIERAIAEYRAGALANGPVGRLAIAPPE